MPRPRTGSVDFYRGRWRARVAGETIGMFDSDDDAWRAVGAWLRRDEDSGPLTTRGWFARWLDERETGGDIRGVDKERSVYRQHIDTAPWADTVLRRVRPIDIQAHLTALSKKRAVSAITFGKGEDKRVELRETDRTLSRQTVIHVRRILYDGFGAAQLAGKITSNPVTDAVKVPKMERVQEDEDVWSWMTLPEIERLFDVLPSARLRAFFAVAIYVGLRDGELLGVRWQDVHLDAKVPNLDVRKSYDGPTKTKGSRRTVPLLPPVLAALREYRKEVTIAKIGQLVFPADDGGCLSKGYDAGWPDKTDNTNGNSTGWRTKAKVRDHVRFHDLRHTCASHLVQGSWGRAWTLHQVMQWMGHADIKTTLRYAHLAPHGLLQVAGDLWNESGSALGDDT